MVPVEKLICSPWLNNEHGATAIELRLPEPIRLFIGVQYGVWDLHLGARRVQIPAIVLLVDFHILSLEIRPTRLVLVFINSLRAPVRHPISIIGARLVLVIPLQPYPRAF